MGMTDTCRVCLCGWRRLHTISDTLFQEIWEKLTNAQFNSNDGKSLLVCYICCAQLRKSHQLMKRALEAEKLLTNIVNNGSEQSQNALLLSARQSFGFDYKYIIEHQNHLDSKQFQRNIMERIKEENEGGSEEDNVGWSVINIKEEDEDSSQEDNLDNTDVKLDTALDDNTPLKQEDNLDDADVELDTPIDDNTPLKQEDNLDDADVELDTPIDDNTPLKQEDNLDDADVKLDTPIDDNTPLKQTIEREVRLISEKIDIGSSARKRTLNEVPPKAKRIKLIETTRDRYPLTNALLKSMPKSKCKKSYKSFSKNKRNIESVANCINKISPKVTVLPKQVKSVIAQGSETLTSNVICNNAENETIQQCLLKSADVVAPSISFGGSDEGKPSSICNPRKGLENKFSCHMCQYKDISKSNLNKHLCKHISGEKPYICDLCDYRCSNKSHLQNHVKCIHMQEKKFSCNVCQYKCVTKSNLKKHLRKHTGEKPYICDFCDYRCSQKDSLERHIKFKHTKEKNFSCHVCHYKCVTKSNLNKHLHKHTGEKPYGCNFCDYRFSIKSRLENHIKCIHIQERNFSCHVCQYKCVTQSDLNKHLRKHTGEKPYGCDFCNYRCTQKGSLERHIKFKHTKEKNFSCHVCHYKCVTKSNLNKHLRKHAGEKPNI